MSIKIKLNVFFTLVTIILTLGVISLIDKIDRNEVDLLVVPVWIK